MEEMNDVQINEAAETPAPKAPFAARYPTVASAGSIALTGVVYGVSVVAITALVTTTDLLVRRALKKKFVPFHKMPTVVPTETVSAS